MEKVKFKVRDQDQMSIKVMSTSKVTSGSKRHFRFKELGVISSSDHFVLFKDFNFVGGFLSRHNNGITLLGDFSHDITMELI